MGPHPSERGGAPNLMALSPVVGDEFGGGDDRWWWDEGRINEDQPLIFDSNSALTLNNRARY